jgi:hypothetical protein
MKQFLEQLKTIPEVDELIRRVEDGGCPAAVTGLQPVQRACVGAAAAAAIKTAASAHVIRRFNLLANSMLSRVLSCLRTT